MSRSLVLQWDVILYVEDDTFYAEIMHFALKEGGFKHRLIHLASALEAREYLTGTGLFADREQYPMPALVLADLKMPKMTGLELLQWVRNDSLHRTIPFVILTSSDDLKDVAKAYQLGANSFLLKPPTVPELIELMKSVDTFWIKHNVTSDQ